MVDYSCPDNEEIPGSGLCIFHDKNYLKEDKNNRKEREEKVRDRLMDKIVNSINQEEALLCIGYHLPDITFEGANFTQPVHFCFLKIKM
jgi:hypothetical protein